MLNMPSCVPGDTAFCVPGDTAFAQCVPKPNVYPLTILLSQVPSATPKLVEMFLDMVSENERQQRLPQRDVFDNGRDQFKFYDGICGYLQGMTTRSCANIFTPHGGGAGSNNATEAQNKVSHQQMPIRRHPVKHISEMLPHMHTISRRDVSFNDWFRRDMWHHDLFLAVWHLMHFVAFPTDVACPAINVMHLVTTHCLQIDRLDPTMNEF